MTAKAYVGAGIRDLDTAKKDLIERLSADDMQLDSKVGVWIASYDAEEWTLECNAVEAPIGGTYKLPRRLLQEFREELLALAQEHLIAGNGLARDVKKFDFEAGKAMRNVVTRHMPVEQFAYTASSWKFWASISVYLLPDVVRWRWWGKGPLPEHELYKKGEQGAAGIAGKVLDRFGLTRHSTLVRDTFARIWWKNQILDQSGSGVGMQNYAMPDSTWQERPSIFNRHRAAENVGNVTGAAVTTQALPHGGHEQWAKVYGGAFPAFDPDYVDLPALDKASVSTPNEQISYDHVGAYDSAGGGGADGPADDEIALRRGQIIAAHEFSDEPVSRILGVKNSGGFRWSNGWRTTLLVALYIHPGNDGGWYETIRPDDETFLYHGDARDGKNYEEAQGNRILLRLDRRLSALEDRRRTPAFFVFEHDKGSSYGRRFIGVAVPDVSEATPWLNKITYRHDGGDHVNLSARFRLLDIDEVPKQWVADLQNERSDTNSAPEAWARWVELGHH